MKKYIAVCLFAFFILGNVAQAQTTNTGSNAGTGAAPNTGSNAGTGGAANTGSNAGTPGIGAPSKTTTLTNPLSSKFNSVGGIVDGFVQIFMYLVIILGVLALVWVGFQFIVAQGDVKRITELRGYLVNIVIGIAIVISARVIVKVVINSLAATGAVNPAFIQSATKAASGQ